MIFVYGTSLWLTVLTLVDLPLKQLQHLTQGVTSMKYSPINRYAILSLLGYIVHINHEQVKVNSQYTLLLPIRKLL